MLRHPPSVRGAPRPLHMPNAGVPHPAGGKAPPRKGAANTLHLSLVWIQVAEDGPAEVATAAAPLRRSPLGKPPPPPAAAAAPPPAEASNFSEQLLRLGSGAAAARQSLTEALGATDAVARATSGLTAGPVAWHQRLSEVRRSSMHAAITPRRWRLPLAPRSHSPRHLTGLPILAQLSPLAIMRGATPEQRSHLSLRLSGLGSLTSPILPVT